MLRFSHHWAMALGMIIFLACTLLPAVQASAAGQPTLIWNWFGSYTAFYETADNTGQMLNVENYLTVILQDGGTKVFAVSDGTDMVAGTHYKLEGTLPTGVVLHVLKVDDTHVKIYLDGTATNHTAANNVDGLKISFLAKAFSDNNLANVTNPAMTGLGVHFYTAALSYEPNPMNFNEGPNNDGSIDPLNVLTVVLNGPEQFVEEDFVDGVQFASHHVPAGLTAKVTRLSNTRLQITLQGNAEHHDVKDSDQIEIEFLNAAFASGSAAGVVVTNTPIINVNFSNPKTLSWNTNEFVESAAGDGSIDTIVVVTLTGDNPDSFSSPNGPMADDLYKIENVPEGLTPLVYKTSDSRVEIRLNGKAVKHTAADSITNMHIYFKNAAFVGEDAGAIAGTNRSDIKVTFKDSAVVTPPVTPPSESTSVVATFTLGRATYQVNGVGFQMDIAPYMANNRTYVPVRYLAYALGLKDSDIVWEASSERVFLTKDGKTVFLQIGNMYLNNNGQSQQMDVAPEVSQDRVCLPARWVAEAFGAKVEWVQDTNTVIISKQ